MIHDMITDRIPTGYPSRIRNRTRNRMNNEILDRGVEGRSEEKNSKVVKRAGEVSKSIKKY